MHFKSTFIVVTGSVALALAAAASAEDSKQIVDHDVARMQGVAPDPINKPDPQAQRTNDLRFHKFSLRPIKPAWARFQFPGEAAPAK